MAKKTKNGKKGSDDGVGGKGSDEKEKISEVEKEWFQIQLKALEEKLQKKTEKMKAWEALSNEYKEKHKNLLEDKADVVAFLTRTLLQKNDKISELQERLEGLQNIHAVEKQGHEMKLRTLEQDFVKMKEQLVSENMVLAKKLDALEEFKIQREQILAKQAQQEKDIQELKSEYEKKIYSIEKKHIIEEDRLKNDMTAKLEYVASEFRQASHAQMSATTQRTVRENVNLSAQVNQLSEKNSSLDEENRKLDEGCRKIKKTMTAIEEEEKRLIHVNAHRLKVIQEMGAKCEVQEKSLQTLGSYYVERRNLELKINTLEGEIKELEESARAATKENKEKTAAIADLQTKMNSLKMTNSKIKMCLVQTAGSIKLALDLQKLEKKSDDEESQREDVLNQVLYLLNTTLNQQQLQQLQQQQQQQQQQREGEAETKLPLSYLHGSLGLVPAE